jgi:hypothetical protein
MTDFLSFIVARRRHSGKRGIGPRQFGAGLLTPPMRPTAGLLPHQETCGQRLWLGQPQLAAVPETSHNAGTSGNRLESHSRINHNQRRIE